MALGLNKTKRRIRSVTSTAKITKAMEMVATVKLKRFKDLYAANALYQDELVTMMAEALAHDEEAATHYAKENEGVEGVLYLVITSNLGLCAGYNNEIFKYVDSLADMEKDTIVPIGEKGKLHFTHDARYKNVITDLAELDLSMDPRLIDNAAFRLKEDFNARKYRKIVLVYTRYINSLTFKPDSFNLLPTVLPLVPEDYESYCPPLFEPKARQLIHVLMVQYLGGMIYGKLEESQYSEQASRRTAMENANDNADELLQKLTIEYNKARQAAITQEIVEVVGGSNNQR